MTREYTPTTQAGRAAETTRAGTHNPPFSVRGPVIFSSTVMLIMAVAVGGWAARAGLSGAVIAAGTFVVDRNVKKVQHSHGGIVAEILVRNGDRVETGQVVMRLDATQIKAEMSIVDTQLSELSLRAMRFFAERDNLPSMVVPQAFLDKGPEARQAAEGELRLFEENRHTRESQKEQLGLRIDQIKEEITGLLAQRDAKKGELAIIAQEHEQVSQLQRKALTPITRVYAMEREMKRIAGEHGGLVAQIARANVQISEIKMQIIAVDENARAQAQREHRSIETKLAELAERAVASRDKLNRIDIRAPQAGVVHELAVHTIGGIVTPAEQMMLIVPEADTLAIQARIAPGDVDQLAVGRPARLRLSALSQEKTPDIDGRLVSISADISTDPKSGQSHYIARLEMLDKERRSVGNLKLVPGMPVEVLISTGERTALSYLLKPFTDQMNRAFRE